LGNSREISRGFFSFRQEIHDFCPNSTILLPEQGISREFSVFELNHSNAEW
jgi:hypothetical protein